MFFYTINRILILFSHFIPNYLLLTFFRILVLNFVNIGFKALVIFCHCSIIFILLIINKCFVKKS